MGCAPSGSKHIVTNTILPDDEPDVTIPSRGNWEFEASKIHKAVEGVGTDEDAIVTILASYKNRERQRIVQAYEKLYQKDLLFVLKSELSLGYQDAIIALLMKPENYDAKSLHDAFSDMSYDTIVEIICSRRPDALEDIKDAYEEEFMRPFDEDLENINDKDLRDLLLKFCSEDRFFRRSKANQSAAQARAQQLLRQKDLVELLCEPLGRNQLKATFKELEELTSKSMDDFITEHYKESSEDTRMALNAYVSCIVSPPTFFAKELHRALDKLYQDNNMAKVLRILVTRSETDLYFIKKEYLSRYSTNLSKAIRKKSYGGYKALKIIIDIRGQYTESAVKK